MSIVKNLIRKAVFKKFAKKMLALLIVSVFLAVSGDGFLKLTNQCQTVTSVHEAQEVSKKWHNYVSINLDELFETGILEETVSKVYGITTKEEVTSNYLFAMLDDGILLVKVDYKDYQNGAFDGEHFELKGTISSITDNHKVYNDLRREFQNVIGDFPEDIFENGIGMCVFTVSTLEDSALFFVFFSIIAITLIILLLRDFIFFVNYKSSKYYKSLANLNCSMLEDAEEKVGRDYEKNKDNSIFEDDSIYVSEEFLILKDSVLFFNTNDLRKVDYVVRYNKKYTTYRVLLVFASQEMAVGFSAYGPKSMQDIVIALKTKVLNMEEV